MPSGFSRLLVPFLVGAGLLAGFVREIYLAYQFGISREVEIFRVAFGLPSILSEALAVSFVSVLIRELMLDDDRDGVIRVLYSTIVVSGFLYLFAITTMSLQADFLAPGFSAREKSSLVVSGVLCWTMFFAVVLSLPLRAMMSVNGRLWPGAGSALIRSLLFIIGLYIIAEFSEPLNSVSAGLAALIGGFCVLVVHFLALDFKSKSELKSSLLLLRIKWKRYPVMVSLLAVFGTQLLLSGGRVIDRSFASVLDLGALASIEYSYAIVMAFSAFVGTSLNIYLAPRLVSVIKGGNGLPSKYFRAIIFVSSAALIVGLFISYNSNVVVEFLFQRGSFDVTATKITASVLQLHALALGLVVFSLIYTQLMIFFGKQYLLLRVTSIKLAVKTLSVFVLMALGYGLAGLASSFIIAELVYALLLAFFVTKYSHVSVNGN